MSDRNERIPLESLENQLESLKRLWNNLDLTQLDQWGQWAQEFTVWLERAKPWIGCAASLITLRVEQIVGDLDHGSLNRDSLLKFRDLLQEAERHLNSPGSPIQVIDLEEKNDFPTPDTEGGNSLIFFKQGSLPLRVPAGLVEIPNSLQPETPTLPFRFLIPN